MDERRLWEVERLVAAPARQKAHEDRDAEERLEYAVVAAALSSAAPELLLEVQRLREENEGLRHLLKSPYQGEYAYDNDAAIDTALAELRAR